MTKCAFIPNFLKFYNILWQAALPFLRRNPRLGPTFEKRTTADHLGPADIWIQAASAGEAFLALAILAELKPTSPTKVLVTATTDQGLGILNNGIEGLSLPRGTRVFAEIFPFDMPDTVRAAVRKVRPRVMVLLETELWPALLYTLKQQGVTILILNARMSERSGRHYRWTRGFWHHLAPDRILAISPEDAARYSKVFPKTRTETMTNIKFDTMTGADAPAGSDLSRLFPGPLPLSILASFRRQEEDLVMEMLNHLKTAIPNQVIALFPRHMHRIPKMKKQLGQAGIPFVLRSELHGPLAGPGLVLWDVFGELRQAYHLADTVFVGGSLLPLGGQNFIEPAILGIPTVIGPHWTDFSWVGQNFFHLGFVSCCPDVRAAAEAMTYHLKTQSDKSANQRAALDYIRQQQGGAAQACQAIAQALKPKSS